MSRHVRAKNGRTVVASPARLQRIGHTPGAQVAPGAPALAVAVERLADDLVRLALARADAKEGRKPDEAIRALEARVTRGRQGLARLGPEGLEISAAITRALTAQGGRLLRTAERACITSRPYGARVGSYLAGLVCEGMRQPLALARAGSYAMHQALADLLGDLVFASDPMVGLAATKSRKLPDGVRLSNALPTFDVLHRLFCTATTTARLELLTALDLEERGRVEERERDRKRQQAAWAVRPTVPVLTDTRVSEPGEDAEAIDVRASEPDEEPAPRAAERDRSSPPGRTSRDDEADAGEPEPGAWCATRGAMVPRSIANKPITAASGADWPQRLAEQDAIVAKWTADMQAARNRLARAQWARRNQ